ncbi:hypothetical protein HWV62_15487 [Athelia sp. TMB]|nr:hypothetical protein HWV62_15487 [Athelia sp. TMB]
MWYRRYLAVLFLPLAISTGVPYTAYTQFIAKTGELDPLATGKSCPEIRVRKEWRALTEREREEWLDGIQCLGSMPAPPGYRTARDVEEGIEVSLYDAFSWIHSKLNVVVHGNAYFLPWHAPSPIDSPIFDTDPTHGLGGSGSPSLNFTLTSGALAGFPLRYPVPHALRRHLSLRPFLDEDPEEKRLNGTFSKERVERLFAKTSGANDTRDSEGGDFYAFTDGMSSVHNAVHNFLGGDAMGECPPPILEADCDRDTPGLSPNEPMFWLHHAQVDRLWNQALATHASEELKGLFEYPD